jgi:hypothetical protein
MVAACSAQDPPAPAELLRSAEEALLAAKTVRATISSDAGEYGTATATLLLGEGGKLRRESKTPVKGGPALEGTIVSDGRLMRQVQMGQAAAVVEAPKDFSREHRLHLARGGLCPGMRMPFHFIGGAQQMAHTNVRAGVTQKIGGRTAWGVEFDVTMQDMKVPMKLWIDAASRLPLRREIGGLVPAVETYEIVIDEKLDDSKFLAASGPAAVLAIDDAGSGLRSAAFSADSKTIFVFAAEQQTLVAVDAASGKTLWKQKAEGCFAGCIDAAGRMAATGSNDGRLTLWDLAARKSVRELKFKGGVMSPAFSADGRALALGVGRDLVVVDAEGVERCRLALGPDSLATATALSPKADVVVAAVRDRVRAWEVAGGRELWSLEAAQSLSLGFSPDGRWVAVPTAKGATIVDARQGSLVAAVGRSPMMACAFSMDGRRFAVANGFGTEVGDTGTWKSRANLEPGTGLGSLAFSPDGRRILGASHRGIRVWPVE